MIQYFIPGLAAGLILGEKEKETLVSHYPTSHRYALFVTKSEVEALEKITKARSEMGLKGRPVRFDEYGFLVKIIEETGKKGKVRSTKQTLSTIRISRYSHEQLLQIEMFSRYMEPYSSEIMIARYLMQENGK